jgi:hypothetical protein
LPTTLHPVAHSTQRPVQLLDLSLRGESYSLVGFAFVATANLDRHLPIKPFQKIEQLIRRKAAEVSVHQVRHVGLCNAQHVGDFALFQFLVFEDSEDMEPDL